MPFGPGRAWLALPATVADRLAERLRLRTVLPANWRAGLAETERQGVFVAPPCGGITFAVGADLRPGVVRSVEELAELVTRLSAEHGRAAWFVVDDDAEVFGWMLAERGELRRGYAFVGDHGPVFWEGEPTAAEHELGCYLDDPRDGSDDEIRWWPDSRIALAIAERWGVDPSRLAGTSGCGVVGRL